MPSNGRVSEQLPWDHTRRRVPPITTPPPDGVGIEPDWTREVIPINPRPVLDPRTTRPGTPRLTRPDPPRSAGTTEPPGQNAEVRDATLNAGPAADVAVLLAVLGRYEAELRGGAVDEHGVRALGVRCAQVGPLPEDGAPDREAVAGILEDIGQRLRYAIGEYSSDPTAS